MSAFLSDEWLSEARAELTDLPVVDGVDGVVQYVVSGEPVGKVHTHVTIEAGQVKSIDVGKHPDPACTVTLSYSDALALLNGELRPEVAFMTGQAKVEGDHRVWLVDLLPFRRQPEVRAALERVREATSA